MRYSDGLTRLPVRAQRLSKHREVLTVANYGAKKRVPWWVYCVLSPVIPTAWFVFCGSSGLDDTGWLVLSDFFLGRSIPLLLFLFIGLVLFVVQGALVGCPYKRSKTTSASTRR
jgi:hypothetical protein